MRELYNKKNHIYICIYMDLSKAFDKLIMIDMNKLNYYGIDGIEFQWFRSYCSGMAEASRILVHAIELWAQDSVFFHSDPLLDFFPYW